MLGIVREYASKYAILLKAVDISTKSSKEIGALGESVAAAYLVRHGMQLLDRNVARKTGELDLVAREGNVLHIVEVKTLAVEELPLMGSTRDDYDPSANLHAHKIHKVARTAEWYVLNIDWEGEWQLDGCLVWLRKRDGRALVRFFPQIA